MKQTLLLLSMALSSHLISGQNINPKPHQLTYGTQTISIADGINLKKTETADQASICELKSFLSESPKGIKLYIGNYNEKQLKKISKGVSLPAKSGAYYLRVTPKQIIVMGYDNRGTFYGVQTLKKLLNKGELKEVEITDYPDTQFRGVVEGFYGYPWSHEKRLELIKFLGANKMDTYIYGPKDDPYHSSLSNPTFSKHNVKGGWRLPYPAEEAVKIEELVQASKRNKV
ncbi:MAG: beta-N-acetylglucosaminidase domain-containing protein, partial [Phocaeicola sp.]